MASSHQKKSTQISAAFLRVFSVIRITQENAKVKAMITFQLYNF